MPCTPTGVVSVFILSVHGRERLPNDQRVIWTVARAMRKDIWHVFPVLVLDLFYNDETNVR